MASTINLLTDLTELVELYKPLSLYLKPISRLNISVQLPLLKDPNKIISNWDVIEKLKRLIAPHQFSSIKVSKSSLEFVRFEAEIDNRDILQRCVKILDNASIKMIGFFDTFKVKAAEAKSEFPTKHAWDCYFRDAKNVDETKPGERPDTIFFEKLPCKWFQDAYHSRRRHNDAACSSNDCSEPSELALRRVFEIFGDIRSVDIPQLDPSRQSRIASFFTFNSTGQLLRVVNGSTQTICSEETLNLATDSSHSAHVPTAAYLNLSANATTMKTFQFGADFTFDAYVQFLEYMSFVKAMDALRNMKLVHVDKQSHAYAANIKVDFDRSKHQSDKNIRRRRIFREKFLREEKLRLEYLKREEETRKRRVEEERLRFDLEKRFTEKQQLDRRRDREEKRKIKQLERKRKEEEGEIERQIRFEERKLIAAQRKLESIRLLGVLFKLAKPIKCKEKVAQEIFELEEAQQRENEKNLRAQHVEQEKRENILKKKEEELRAKMLRKYNDRMYEREEFQREKLRDKLGRQRTFLSSVVATPKNFAYSKSKGRRNLAITAEDYCSRLHFKKNYCSRGYGHGSSTRDYSSLDEDTAQGNYCKS